MKRSYWTNPDVFEIEVDVKPIDDCRVTIDPIIFHPDEGGQPADRGTIGSSKVCNVEIIDGRIVHTLDKSLPQGKHIARLDNQHRLHTAAQHTAQHIISGIAQKQFHLNTTGVHIGLEKCTVDFDKKIDWETAKKLERQSMDVVTLNLPVETMFNEPDVRVRSEFKEIESDIIRVVKIGDYDKSPCCGAHLGNTGQVGIIRIFDAESKKEGTRIGFLAGKKALEFSQLETSVLRELRKSIRCSTAELPTLVQKSLDQTNKLQKEINRLWSVQLPDLAQSARIIEIESSKVGIQVADIPQKLIAKLAALIAQETTGAGIVVSDTNIAVSSQTLNAGDLLKIIQNTTGGKGGGSPQTAQGKLDRTTTSHEISAILQEYSN
ncbi:hypothetical protein ACFL02_07120 [Planctomycetota bacterium]